MKFKLEELSIKMNGLNSLLLMMEQALFSGEFNVDEYQYGVHEIINISYELKEKMDELLKESLEKDVV